MSASGHASIGWDLVGDLSGLDSGPTGKGQVRTQLEQHYPNVAQVTTKAENQLYQFAMSASEGDVVVAMDGTRVLGLGKISGGYEYRPDDAPGAHRRKVRWLSTNEWKLPEDEGLRTTFVRLKSPRT